MLFGTHLSKTRFPTVRSGGNSSFLGPNISHAKNRRICPLNSVQISAKAITAIKEQVSA